MNKKVRSDSPKKNTAPSVGEQTNVSVKPAKKKKKGSGLLGRIIRRFFLLLFTIIILALVFLVLVMNLVFKGPSPAARNVLTMSLLEPSATKWIPGLFMGDEMVEEIRNAGKDSEELDIPTETIPIVIDRTGLSTGSDEWAAYPDGIQIKEYKGKTFNAHIMLIQDPSRVYLGLSTYDGFSTSKPGKRLNVAIEDEKAAAAINAGAFNDNGTADSTVGSVPAGLTIHGSKVVSNQYKGLVPEQGFCGFDENDILVVAKTMSEAEATQLKIRDGCEFGPVLIVNGVPNQEVYSGNSGYNPRTVVGQRADGVVIFVCADGRQAGSMGATYKDMIDILMEYGAVNACNMDGGSSSVMLYRDTNGIFGEPGEVQMINSYSVLQKEPRRMPNFWMVRPLE